MTHTRRPDTGAGRRTNLEGEHAVDPNACLDELLSLTSDWLEPGKVSDMPAEVDVERVAELAHSLDSWLFRGGCLPSRWAPAARH